jgi:hypothetical protein
MHNNVLHWIAKSVISFAKRLQKNCHFRQPMNTALYAMKKSIQIIAITLALAGCTSISNVSTNPEFSEFVGHELTLKKQVLVCRDKPLKTESGSYADFKLIYNINQNSRCFFGETVDLLLPGSKLLISKVEKHEIFDVKTTTHIYFIGSSNLQNGSPFEFYYMYGHEGFYENQPW